jgi:hypothetical protein
MEPPRQYLTSKTQDVGIRFMFSREDYMSKSSFLDGDPVIRQLNYSGERISRGQS